VAVAIVIADEGLHSSSKSVTVSFNMTVVIQGCRINRVQPYYMVIGSIFSLKMM